MIDPDSKTFALLYCDEDDELVGLDEVQYLDPIPVERIAPLRALLSDDDIFIRYQASVVLAAWADPVGLAAVGNYIRQNIHEYQTLTPHRISGVDTVYDEFANALALGLSVAEKAGIEVIRETTLELLARYELHYFRSGIRGLTQKLSGTGILPQLTSAIERATTAGLLRQASELLESVSRADPVQAWRLVDLFRDASGIAPEAQANVCDALAYIRTSESRALLAQLSSSEEPGVQTAALESLVIHQDD